MGNRMPRSLIVLPDDSYRPILDAIRGATKSLRIKMFVLSDPRILRALLQAHKRSVRVRVMLSPHRRDGERQNDASRRVLRRGGIEVLDTSPAFDVTHEKSMIADGKIAFVQSLNWTPRNFKKTRDYAVITTDAREVAEIIECFEADWRRQTFSPSKRSHLIWCPQEGRERIVSFIDSAKRSLIVQNERYQDAIITSSISVRAKLRGVTPWVSGTRTTTQATSRCSLRTCRRMSGFNGFNSGFRHRQSAVCVPTVFPGLPKYEGRNEPGKHRFVLWSVRRSWRKRIGGCVGDNRISTCCSSCEARYAWCCRIPTRSTTSVRSGSRRFRV